MPAAVVVIVGRPNVGKSSLFNSLAGRRIAIVEPTAGVTRDRLSAPIDYEGKHFELVDTGGIGIQDEADLANEVERQIQIALKEAELILFTVDIREGLVPLDREIAGRLRVLGKPVVVVANKADTAKLVSQAADFYELGYEPVVPVSATHKRGRTDLMNMIIERLPPSAAEAGPAEIAVKFAIVGKRNVGKSTFINTLVKIFTGSDDARVIVSELPGTTRDAIDVRFEKDGLAYLAIDTAGVRKRSRLSSDVEFYSLARAERAIRRADVVLLLIDATTAVSSVDKHLARYVLDQAKPCVIVVNKWDLAEGRTTTGEFADYLSHELRGMNFAPVAFTTATDGRNVQSTVDLARLLFKQAGQRVSTSKLNGVVRKAVEAHRPPSPGGKPLRIYYATQISTRPPTVVFFVNNPDLVTQQYRRYLENCLRDALPFGEVPILLHFRPRQRGKQKR